MRNRRWLAVVLTLTWPIWVIPVLICYVVFGLALILYTSICDALEVK